MLSVPTLWTVFVINFLALGLIWAYVMRSYPKFEAARFWTGSAFAAAVGAAMATVRFATEWDSLLPLLAGGTVLIFAACLAAMGVKRFYGQPVTWRGTALITGLSSAGLAYFIFGHDSMSMRILIYSVGQSLPFALTLKPLLSRHNGRANPGGRLAAIVTIIIIAIYALRAANLSRCPRSHRASAGLTMRQLCRAFWIDPELAIGVFIISKPRRGLLPRGETPLSDVIAL
ncbi:MAG TPA: hypothetical protein VGJ68_18090 [Bradyrhizobium sp.]